jgi:hypothetical protein
MFDMPFWKIHWLWLLTWVAYGQIADSAPDVVANIPVNYTEAKAGTYTLPDPLKLNNGQTVRDAKTWFAKRRPEIRTLIEENWFGRSPGRPKDISFDVIEKDAPAFDGKAIRRQVTIYLTKDRTGPKMDLLIYLPANAKGPAPLFLNMSFAANNLSVADPGVKVGRRWDPKTRTQVAADSPPTPARSLRVEQFIAHGIGIATFNKDDLAPDFVGSEGLGVKSLYLKPGQTKPEDGEWAPLRRGHGAPAGPLTISRPFRVWTQNASSFMVCRDWARRHYGLERLTTVLQW